MFYICQTVYFSVVVYLIHLNGITLMDTNATPSLRCTAEVGINTLICLTEDSLVGVELLERLRCQSINGYNLTKISSKIIRNHIVTPIRVYPQHPPHSLQKDEDLSAVRILTVDCN